VNDGKWHHVAGVYDGTKLYLYVDGELDNSEYASGSIATNNYNVWIGAWIDPKGQIVGREWNGLIDDVRIYSYALGEADIKAVYAGEGPGPIARPEWLVDVSGEEYVPPEPEPEEGDEYYVPLRSELKHEEAEQILIERLEELEIRRRVLGEEHRAEMALMINLAELYEKQGRYDEAKLLHVKELQTKRSVLGEEHPSTLASMNNFAWLQATSPKAELRDGLKAIEYATKVCELTGWKKAMYVDTLAAAYAEAGDFTAAVKWQKEAIDLLTEEQPSGWQAEFQARLKLYQAGQPFHKGMIGMIGMIGWWKFDEGHGSTALDWSGHGNDGTLVGDPQWVAGIIDGALELDGDDFVSVDGVADDITRTNITISIWIKTTQEGEGEVFASNDSASSHPSCLAFKVGIRM